MILAATIIVLLHIAKEYWATAPQAPVWLKSIVAANSLDSAIKAIAGLFFVGNALLGQFMKEMLKVFEDLSCDTRIIPDGPQRDKLRVYLQTNSHVFGAFKYPRDKIREFLVRLCEAKAHKL